MEPTYLRGDMYFADLGEGIGSEQKGYRPVIIIQNDRGNKHSATVVVAAISSKMGAKARLPVHCYLKAAYGLQRPSVVLLEQIRTIDKRRLDTYIGRLPAYQMRRVDRALEISVGLRSGANKRNIISLCNTCANSYLNVGVFSLRRIKPKKVMRNVCNHCNQRYGLNYEIAVRSKI